LKEEFAWCLSNEDGVRRRRAMVCNRTLEGIEAQALAAKAMPFGPGLDGVEWVQRVEVWFTEDSDEVDFTEFRVFDEQARWKTVRVAGY